MCEQFFYFSRGDKFPAAKIALFLSLKPLILILFYRKFSCSKGIGGNSLSSPEVQTISSEDRMTEISARTNFFFIVRFLFSFSFPIMPNIFIPPLQSNYPRQSSKDISPRRRLRDFSPQCPYPRRHLTHRTMSACFSVFDKAFFLAIKLRHKFFFEFFSVIRHTPSDVPAVV